MTLVPATVILPALGAACLGAAACLYLSSHAFGTRPQTMSPKWKLMVWAKQARLRCIVPQSVHWMPSRADHPQEEQQVFAKPREAGGPVVLNPIYHRLPAGFTLYKSNNE